MVAAIAQSSQRLAIAARSDTVGSSYAVKQTMPTHDGYMNYEAK